jgi:hypothetical protein
MNLWLTPIVLFLFSKKIGSNCSSTHKTLNKYNDFASVEGLNLCISVQRGCLLYSVKVVGSLSLSLSHLVTTH